MVKYFKQDKDRSIVEEITRKQAIRIISLYYNNPEDVLDTSSKLHVINAKYSIIWKEE